MLDIFKNWTKRYFSDPEAIVLLVLIFLILMLVLYMGSILAPVIASVVLAYLLQGLVNGLNVTKLPRFASVLIVYLGFLGIFLGVFLILGPLIWQQFVHLVAELPSMLKSAQQLLYLLPEKFPEYVTKENIDSFTMDMIQHMRVWGNALVSASISSIPSLFMLIVYLVLVPLMVFFFLKDNNKIINWCTAFLPKERDLLSQVWDDIDDQIGNYVRGKVLEVLIVGAVTYLFLIIFSVQYSVLLATLVGLSVLVPYVGAVVVTFPIVLVAYFQWGIGTQFTYILIGYGIIQSLDGYVLVPLLFSEAVNLHPVAIIVAILFFGGVWGFWGVFFAIPLATVVKAVIDAWPRPHAMVA